MTGSDHTLVLIWKCDILGCLSLLGACKVMVGSQGEQIPKTEEAFDDEIEDRRRRGRGGRRKRSEMVSNTKQKQNTNTMKSGEFGARRIAWWVRKPGALASSHFTQTQCPLGRGKLD